MKTTRKPTFTKNIPTFAGPKKYEFVSLTRREAMETAHNSLIMVVETVGGLSGSMFKEMGPQESEESRNAVLESISKSLGKLSFDKVWKLAESILRGVTIEDDNLIEDINETDYFAENLDEFYSALVFGIEGNFPSVFIKVREALNGFDLAGLVKKPDSNK